MASQDDLHSLRLLTDALRARLAEDPRALQGHLADALADLATRAVALRAELGASAREASTGSEQARRCVAPAGSTALLALRRPAPGVEAVLRMHGLELVRCPPEALGSHARALAPALIVQDPFGDPPKGLRRLYEWRRDPSLARTEVLLVRQGEGDEERALGDVSILCRPLGRADLSGRLRVLVEGLGGVSRALLVGLAHDEAGARLSGILGGMGVETQALADPSQLDEAHPGPGDLVIVPAVFAGEAVLAWVGGLLARADHPEVAILLSPDDPEHATLRAPAGLTLPAGMRPLARALDRVLARVARHQQSLLGVGREVLTYRAFSMAVERGLDYARRHGRRLLIAHVRFAGPLDALPEHAYRELELEVASLVRAHDLVAATRGRGLLLMLAEAGPEHLPHIRQAVFEPAHAAAAARLGQALPPLEIRTFEGPGTFQDFSDLLAQIG